MQRNRVLALLLAGMLVLGNSVTSITSFAAEGTDAIEEAFEGSEVEVEATVSLVRWEHAGLLKHTLPVKNMFYSLEIEKPDGEISYSCTKYTGGNCQENGWLAYDLFDMDGEYKARVKISKTWQDYDFSGGAVSDVASIYFEMPTESYDVPGNPRWRPDGTAVWDAVSDTDVEYIVKIYKNSKYQYMRRYITQTSYKPDLSQMGEGDWTFTVTASGDPTYKNPSEESPMSPVLGKENDDEIKDSDSTDESEKSDIEDEKPEPVKDGLAQAEDGNWYLYENGHVNKVYNGFFNDCELGWWLVLEGRVALEFSDLYYDADYGWWKIASGAVDFGFSDLYESPKYGWWKINGGRVDFEFNDFYCSPMYGWWKINCGKVDFEFTDIYGSASYGWWKVNGGAVDFGFTDLYESPSYGWWLVNGGMVDFGYSDVFRSPQYGDWFVYGGAVAFGFTGQFDSPKYGSCYVDDAAVTFQ